MIESSEIYRTYVKTINTQLSAYISIVAWKNGCDCILIERDDLMTCFGLKALSQERRKWLEDDCLSFFKYFKLIVFAKGNNKMACCLFSRKEIPGPSKNQLIPNYINELNESGLSTKLIKLPHYNIIVSRLAGLSHGIEPACFDEDK